MYHISSVCNWREGFEEERDDLKRKLDDVVDLFNAHLHHKKAWSDNPYYDRVQQRLNKIMEGN
ncbi:hypothetical protein Q1I16_002257 [Staphylococcus pseudintermedius]|nr:hypothetical protein [Staphylococcus pseudintermedius]ELH1729097.1 hypothetical protein [Staphylococcus pseudintermedius]ELH1744110.1 hypothetical protein [Staphylococcus pseudintermedius]ELK4507255.1 hypothetical protein [Staphylococcus pseudintermedius]ELN1796986.1 hypothetical protein [Staphylococcus pseudintermedius]